MSEKEKKDDFWKQKEEEIKKYLEGEFFTKEDRKLAFYIGNYYNYSSYLQQKELGTKSLAGNLPNLTRTFDENQFYNILNFCNKVLRSVASKNKQYS